MKYTKRFVDSLRIFAKAGTGGNGIPKYGGFGGKGGDVILECVEDCTLVETKKILSHNPPKAKIGQHSSNARLIGEDGEDAIVPVPIGTYVLTDQGRKLGELTSYEDRILVARGGEGGCPANQYFGQKGESHHVTLLLKLIADIGLVGFPNAGKSTLLGALSNARPKVANYPFTTLHPTVGALEYEDGRSIAMADLPGLIEGAWANFGMGHNFLRHIERTKLLLFVIDIHGFQLSPKHPERNAAETLILLNRELELYQPDLVEKPCMLVINKMDKPGSKNKLSIFKEQLKNLEEVSLTLPEEARPDRFVEFDNIITCAARSHRPSLKAIKEKLRTQLDYYEDLNYEQEQTLQKATLQTQSSLEEKIPKLM